jgi:formate hydrogenlyase subunit 4
LILLHLLLLLGAPPLFLGVVNRVKAIIGGRRGPPILQVWYDVAKLLRKGAVYSGTTTFVFRAGPLVSFAAILVAGLCVPIAGLPAPLRFPGDCILVAALLGLARFATILAAMDTGSSFEGMGASREATFGALAEPALFSTLCVLVIGAGSTSLSSILGPELPAMWGDLGAALVLVATSLFVLLLAENSRIPVDDPNTHLELTMIHEVMVLDHGGPDLAFIVQGAATKLFLFAALLARVLVPSAIGFAPADFLLGLLGLGLVAVIVGVIESSIARLRMPRVPAFLGAALVFGIVAMAVLFTVGGPK